MQRHTASLAAARSLLFVPADRPERYASALSCGAGAVIIDLEDAVAPANKTTARDHLVTGVAAFSAAEKARVLVRVNAWGTPWHEDDVGQLALLGLGGVMLSKAERVADLVALAKALGPTAALVPLIESGAGLDALDAIAGAPQVLRLAFGHLDFQADLGLRCDAGEAELIPVRLALVRATRRAGLVAPIDGVTPDLKDIARLQADAQRARRGGFGAKLCIHPQQVETVQAAFAPTADELVWALNVREAVKASGGGVVNLNGRMVDAPVVRLAEQLLAFDSTKRENTT